ncbi:hypothetical protein NDU88_005605 [Pleurodeles waltl]|uniref:Uncharacterized protein n=1 Tax=Pleurodeles waltl TaxID=8319 RepID=A0AAV7X1Q1_PLEWA|nr:hypothetical protein NDU88_005605 [Pleurodeles waltl]
MEESRKAMRQMGESGAVRRQTEESGEARRQTKESREARKQTEERGETRRQTEERGETRRQTEESKEARRQTEENGETSKQTGMRIGEAKRFWETRPEVGHVPGGMWLSRLQGPVSPVWRRVRGGGESQRKNTLTRDRSKVEAQGQH